MLHSLRYANRLVGGERSASGDFVSSRCACCRLSELSYSWHEHWTRTHWVQVQWHVHRVYRSLHQICDDNEQRDALKNDISWSSAVVCKWRRNRWRQSFVVVVVVIIIILCMHYLFDARFVALISRDDPLSRSLSLRSRFRRHRRRRQWAQAFAAGASSRLVGDRALPFYWGDCRWRLLLVLLSAKSRNGDRPELRALRRATRIQPSIGRLTGGTCRKMAIKPRECFIERPVALSIMRLAEPRNWACRCRVI